MARLAEGSDRIDRSMPRADGGGRARAAHVLARAHRSPGRWRRLVQRAAGPHRDGSRDLTGERAMKKDHDDWIPDFSVSDLGLVTTGIFKKEWQDLKKAAKKSEGGPDAACVDEIVERILVTRRVTVYEVHVLRRAFLGVIKGRSSEGVGEYQDALDALDALDAAVEHKGSPLAIMYVIAQITDEEHWEDQYKKSG